MKKLSRVYTGLVLAFLFAPIVILLIYSFNEAKSLSVFTSFSLKWYEELFRDGETLNALRNTLLLALCATAVSTVMGTAAAVGIHKLRSRYLRFAMDTVTNIPMINPDIITGISLMLMFVFVGSRMGKATSLGFGTMLLAHITFCLPYVIMQVLPKLQQQDSALAEAAMDLGCTPLRAFFRVELPELMPGIVTGAIMAFTLSLDDFVISYFTQGNDFQTLPIRIYSMTKKTVTPKMYALATIIFFTILALLLISNFIDNADRKEKRKDNHKKLRLVYTLLGALVVIVTVYVLMLSRPKVLNVYNWGEYISDGSEDSLDTVKEFELWYEETYGEKVRVNYTTFASCEDMYAKLNSGAVSYDVVIPSDYMIAKMREENMLLPIDYENIPNFENIPENFRNLYYDPENRYTVPYTYGVVGVIFNANAVDEADAQDWELLWNEKYQGQILQFNNPRDAFGTAMYRQGIDVNTRDETQWRQALDALKAQKPLVKSYVMDEIYNMMESGEAAIGAYYAGDYFTMLDSQAEDVDLRFYYPERTNYFVDAMCIPSCCQDQALAECFINFMLSEEPAIANAEYIYYASPNRVVYESETYAEEMGEEAMEILYEGQENFKAQYEAYAYRSLDKDTLALENTLWEELKIN